MVCYYCSTLSEFWGLKYTYFVNFFFVSLSNIYTARCSPPGVFSKSIILEGLTNSKENDCNGTRPHSHLVRKRPLNHLAKGTLKPFNHLTMANLAKLLNVPFRTKLISVQIPLQSLNLEISRMFQARSSLTFRKLESVDSLWNKYVAQ